MDSKPLHGCSDHQSNVYQHMDDYNRFFNWAENRLLTPPIPNVNKYNASQRRCYIDGWCKHVTPTLQQIFTWVQRLTSSPLEPLFHIHNFRRCKNILSHFSAPEIQWQHQRHFSTDLRTNIAQVATWNCIFLPLFASSSWQYSYTEWKCAEEKKSLLFNRFLLLLFSCFPRLFGIYEIVERLLW